MSTQYRIEPVVVDSSCWFWFCPCYFDSSSFDMAPIPRGQAWWLFNAALLFQETLNWLCSLADTTAPAAGYYFHHVTSIPPRTIQLRILLKRP